jgi:hypothetical protein
MSDESAKAARSDEPEVEGHIKAWGPEDPMRRGGPAERQLLSEEPGEPEGPDVEGHMAPLGTEERPVRLPPSEESDKPEGPEVEGHDMRAGRAARPPVEKQL